MRGSICALVTPFLPEGGLDLEAFGQLLDFQIEGGTQGFVVAGSTGEAHMLEADEYERLLAFALERVAGRLPIYAGCSEAGTAKTLHAVRRAAALGADGALVATPYYVRPTQEGLRRHYLGIADEGGLPVLLYNVPIRTGCDLLPDTVAALREHPHIVGIKEAVADPARIRALATLADKHFVYLSGDDSSAAEAMLAGASGVISVAVNMVPRHWRELCDAALSSTQDATMRYRERLEPLLTALNGAPNPIAVKAGMAALGLGQATPRLPLLEWPDSPARDRLLEALRGLIELPSAAA